MVSLPQPVAQLASTLAPRTGELVGICEASRDAMVFAEVAKMWGRHFNLIFKYLRKEIPTSDPSCRHLEHLATKFSRQNTPFATRSDSPPRTSKP